MPDDFPPIPLDSWNAYTADQFGAVADAQVATLTQPPARDDWAKPPAPQPTIQNGTPDETLLPNTENQSLSAQARVANQNASFGRDFSGVYHPGDPEQQFSMRNVDSSDQLPVRQPVAASPSQAPSSAPSPSQAPSSAPSPIAPVAGSGTSDLIGQALNAADQAGVDPGLYASLIQQESNFNPKARSPVGAQGLAQLMPDTARGLGVTDPNDPWQNLLGGARYLKQQLDHFGGDVVKALAAYNAGPGAVEKYGGVPPYAETQKYVDNIMTAAARSQQGSSTDPATGNYTPGPTESLARVGSGLEKQQGDWQSLATDQLNKPYIWGSGSGAGGRGTQDIDPQTGLPKGFDCSGYVSWVMKNGLGVDVPAYTQSAYDKLAPVSGKDAQPGDIVFYNMDSSDPHMQHMAIYLGNGKIIEAGGVARNVNIADVNAVGTPTFRRPDVPPTQQAKISGYVEAASQNAGQTAASTGPQNPLDWLGQQKDRAVSAVFGQEPAGMPASMQPTPSDTLTNPALATRPTIPAPQQTPQPTVFDQAGQALGNSQLMRNLTGTNPNEAEMQARFDQSGVRIPSNPLELLGGSGLGAPTSGEEATNQRNQFIAENNPLRDVPVVGGASTFAAQAAADPTNLMLAGPGIGKAGAAVAREAGTALEAAAPAIREFATSEEGSLKMPSFGATPERQTASPELQKIRDAYTPAPTTATPAPDQFERIRMAFVRGFTDRQVDINQMQKAYSKVLGRPLNADEMAAELQRLSADPAAAVLVDEGLKPAIQSVGRELYPDLRDYVTARSNVQVADALGNDARSFSGGVTKAESEKAIADMQAELGPEFSKVQAAADQVSQFSKDLRQRLVDSGVLSQEQATQMEAMYPDWAKTRILDYMKDPAGGQGAGTKIGLADRQLRSYTIEGTTKAREDPLASTVAYAHQVQQMANKNDAFQAMLKIDQASPTPMLRKVAQDYSPTKNQITMIGFEDGQKVKYVTDNKALGEAINGAGVMSVPEWTKAWQQVFRSLATSRNPVFLAGNAALDIPTYAFRTAIRDGGPQHLPGIMADLAKGYADAFQGLFQGEFRGQGSAAFLKGGGGQSGYFTGSQGQSAQTIADLQRRNVFEINGKADLLRLTKDLLTLKPVEAIGERIELGPRVAAYNRAVQRGANSTQAVIDGRTVTVDFTQGGTVTKYINNVIPFFNVGFQGPVQVARAFRDNPGAFVATTGTLIGLPSVAAEVWNRADPQRAKDYADVPQYVKDQGIVVMLPGDTPTDAQGNRKPLYAVLKLREWAPFAAIAREATARALGDDSKNWAEMAASAAAGLSPTQSTSVGQAGTEALSGIPILPAAAQIGFNKDFFRGRDIVTQRNDQNASAAAKALTPVIQQALDRFGVNAEVRPSAVEFFIRNQGAGVGAAALGASDAATGRARQDTSPTSLPGVGGLVGRFVGNQTGQQLQTARDESLSTAARQMLRQNGITTTPSTISGAVHGIPLRISEETAMQTLANGYIEDAIRRTTSTADWSKLPQAGKQGRMDAAIQAARARAEGEVLAKIPQAVREQRQRTKSAAP